MRRKAKHFRAYPETVTEVMRQLAYYGYDPRNTHDAVLVKLNGEAQQCHFRYKR